MEIQRIGHSLRVCAVDAETATEVVFQAHSSTSQAVLRKIAANKLRYVMRKNTQAEIQNPGNKGN
jgi:hypothetical protein